MSWGGLWGARQGAAAEMGGCQSAEWIPLACDQPGHITKEGEPRLGPGHFVLFPNDFLLAVYFIFILDYGNNRQKANLSNLLIRIQNTF